MSEAGQEKKPEQILNLPIEWHVSDNIQSQYASNVFVQSGQYEMILSFFETRPPIVAGSPEIVQTTIAQLKSIRAECVARIIIDPDLVPKLIEALQNGLNGFLAAKEAEEKASS